MQFALGWFANPILIDGKYPAIMREKIDSKSSAQGFSESRLPMFSPDQSQMVANSSGLADTYFHIKNHLLKYFKHFQIIQKSSYIVYCNF